MFPKPIRFRFHDKYSQPNSFSILFVYFSKICHIYLKKKLRKNNSSTTRYDFQINNCVIYKNLFMFLGTNYCWSGRLRYRSWHIHRFYGGTPAGQKSWRFSDRKIWRIGILWAHPSMSQTKKSSRSWNIHKCQSLWKVGCSKSLENWELTLILTCVSWLTVIPDSSTGKKGLKTS